MKRKITSVLLLVMVLCFVALPVADAAKEVIENGESTIYGTISRERTDDASSGIETNDIYITKSSSNYIFMTITPGLNVKSIESVDAASGFTIVDTTKGSDGSWTVLIKSSNGKVTSETKILEIVIQQEEVGEDCKILIAPLPLSCTETDGKYFISSGQEVDEEIYDQVCGNTTTTTEPGEDVGTGIPVPYIAVAGGILAIAGVYLYSRKQNKMFKI